MKKYLYLFLLIGMNQLVNGQNSGNNPKAASSTPSSVNPGMGILATGDKMLTVAHSGSDGALIKSSSTYSTVDIDAANGDAALRFVKAGVYKWNLRNRPTDDNLEFYELSGGGSRFIIQNSTGNVGIGFDNPSDKLAVGGNVTVNGFTQLGSTSPRIKMLKFTGTTDADNSTSVAHALTKSKILSVTVLINSSADETTGNYYTDHPNTVGNTEFRYYITSTDIVLQDVGVILQGKPYKVLVTYEE